MEKKEDLRTIKSRRLIRQTFMDLMEEKGYRNITVTDIASRALINRKTFYFYYESVEDLYLELVDEYIRLLDFSVLLGEKKINLEDSGFLVRAAAMLEKIREEKRAYLIMMNDPTNTVFHEKLRASFVTLMSDVLNMPTRATEKGMPPQLIQNIYSSVFVEVLKWWLTQDGVLASQALADMISVFSDKMLDALGIQLIAPYDGK